MKILCCLCGTSIEPNDAAMCIDCLRQQFDLSAIISPTNELIACRKCDRFQTTKDHWQHHDLESAGLLAACLKKISAINNGKAKLIEACWIWTEPHCQRLKIKLLFEAGILDDKVKLRQQAVVEFVIKNKQCLDCIREATDHSWYIHSLSQLYSLAHSYLSPLIHSCSSDSLSFIYQGVP